MPGNPKECRQHALNCLRLAKEATTKPSKHAQSWTRLAAELEQAQALLDGLNELFLPAKPTRMMMQLKKKPRRGGTGAEVWETIDH